LIEAGAWTLAAGRTESLLLVLQSGKVLDDAAGIDAVIQCEPESPRHSHMAQTKLS
jgi:hypothetical protein